MPLTSSSGTAQPKQRTINVELNLLGEWLEVRTRQRDERLRWTGALAGIALAATVILPVLRDLADREAKAAAKAGAAAQQRDTLVERLRTQQEQLQPKLDGEAMMATAHQRCATFMGQLFTVLNSTPPRVAVEHVEANVIGGEMVIRTKAVAESYLAAQEFVSLSGQGPGAKSAMMASAKENPALGEEGVAFEVSKKVEVGK